MRIFIILCVQISRHSSETKTQRDNDNKTKLFSVLANFISEIRDIVISIIASVNEEVTFNRIDMDFKDIVPCS